jgi:hypothetical protein
MRCRRLHTTRPTSRGLQEPICHHKKCAIWTRWYGAALVLNGTFRSALVQDLGARGAKEAIASEARMKMGL